MGTKPHVPTGALLTGMNCVLKVWGATEEPYRSSDMITFNRIGTEGLTHGRGRWDGEEKTYLRDIQEANLTELGELCWRKGEKRGVQNV